MLPFILKRLALAIPTLIAISLITFFIARLAPSDPVDILAGDCLIARGEVLVLDGKFCVRIAEVLFNKAAAASGHEVSG